MGFMGVGVLKSCLALIKDVTLTHKKKLINDWQKNFVVIIHVERVMFSGFEPNLMKTLISHKDFNRN